MQVHHNHTNSFIRQIIGHYALYIFTDDHRSRNECISSMFVMGLLTILLNQKMIKISVFEAINCCSVAFFRGCEIYCKNELFSTPFLVQIRAFLVDIRETVVDNDCQIQRVFFTYMCQKSMNSNIMHIIVHFS